MLVGALRAADRRPTQFCAPSIFLRPCFRRPKANRRFTAQKQASPTELPRQVFCKPEQHSPLLPFCLPAVQKSLFLLFIIKFYPHASCLQLSHPFFGPAQIVGIPLFRNPVRTKFPAGTVPYPDYFNELFSEFICPQSPHRFSGPARIVGMPLFRNPVRTKFPAETFHPLRHRGPPCDKRTAAYPSNDVQVGNDLHAIYRIGQFPFA